MCQTQLYFNILTSLNIGSYWDYLKLRFLCDGGRTGNGEKKFMSLPYAVQSDPEMGSFSGVCVECLRVCAD